MTTRLIDSHCHLNILDLTLFDNRLENVLTAAKEAGVGHFLCVSVEPEDPAILANIAETYPDISFSVGIHPNTLLENEWDAAKLMHVAEHKKCIAIGETGLDYYRMETADQKTNQQQRFREHIRASLASSKPLIIHTRSAVEDTLQIMREEHAADIGGVMHCFTEDWESAKRAMDLNFYISFSGIVTFKNATVIQEVAKKIPADRMLIETDAPFLAPVPFRGKPNHPALVKYVAEAIAELRGEDFATIAKQTTENFYRCFRVTP